MEQTGKLDVLIEHAKSLPYCVTINDLTGRYVFVNDAFCDLTEYASDQLLNMKFVDLTHPDSIATNLALDEKLKEGDIPFFQMDKVYITQSNKQKTVLLQVSLIRNEADEPAFYYAQVIDVSPLTHLLKQRKQDESYLNSILNIPETQRFASASYEVLRLFRDQELRKQHHISHVSQELLNPLNGVVGFAEMMKLYCEQGDHKAVEQCYSELKKSCDKLRGAAESLNDISLLESGNAKIRNDVFDLVQLVSNVVESFDKEAEEKGLVLEFVDTLAVGSDLNSDFQKINQIVQQLVSNAIKFTHEGKITVKLLINSKNEYELSVQDTGEGLSNNDKNAIFEPFSCFDGANSDSGMGLAISYRLATAVGGQLTVDSNVERGSTFTLTLPNLS